MTGNKNRRILIVDDNVAIHEDFRKVIGTGDGGACAIDQSAASLFDEPAAAASCPLASYDLDSAYQGQEALARVEQSLREGRPYAMAFVDVRMPPGWDGVETVRRIWESDPDLQVVICTAYSDYSWGEMTRVLGETDRLLLLKKPFDNVEVRQLASALTEKWQLTREARQSVDQLQRLVEERTASLQQANQKLLQVQKLEAVGQLAAGIAHEINTPTQYVGDNAHFLKGAFRDLETVLDECGRLVQAAKSDSVSAEMAAEFERTVARTDLEFLREEIPKAIDQSLDGISRVAGIVRSMKEFAYPDQPNFAAVDLNRALASTLTVARSEWKYVAELETDFDPDLPLVECLGGDLNQVFLSLIINAAHAIGSAVESGRGELGRIRVSTRADGDWVEVRIDDSGTGIPVEIRSRVFDPFFTTKAVGKGTGQGLAIAYNVIAEKHRGEITFQTEIGRGTTFFVRLPISQSGRREPTQSETPLLAH